MTTLTDWLLAQIAEDEAAAKVCAEAFPPPWDVSDRGHSATVRADAPNFLMVGVIDQAAASDGRWPGEHIDHIARHDPARVLAECEAKRRIVERHRNCGTGYGYCDDGGHGWDDDVLGCGDLADLALPYADRPGYDEEWRP